MTCYMFVTNGDWIIIIEFKGRKNIIFFFTIASHQIVVPDRSSTFRAFSTDLGNSMSYLCVPLQFFFPS